MQAEQSVSLTYVLYHVFHQTFLFRGNTALPSPSLCLSLSLFAEHLRETTVN